MTGPRRPIPEDAERLRQVSEIRSYEPRIGELLRQLDELYDERAKLIATLYHQGWRYIDLQRALNMNGGAIAGALNRAARRADEQATDRAADLVNDRTSDHAP